MSAEPKRGEEEPVSGGVAVSAYHLTSSVQSIIFILEDTLLQTWELTFLTLGTLAHFRHLRHFLKETL